MISMETLPVLENAHIAKGARVLVRADFDVPIKGGAVGDLFRVRANIPTFRWLLARGARIRIITHLGRPQGRANAALSARPVALLLAALLKKRILFVDAPFADKAFHSHADSPHILFFENIRFWRGEEKNDAHFAKQLARWGDIYVNEAFASCHRAHASIHALPSLLPHYPGIRLEKELHALDALLHAPRHPFVAVLGGAKLETKLSLIERFLKSAEHVLLGGALANTIFRLQGIEIGASLADRDIMKTDIPSLFRTKKLILPLDVVTARKLRARPRPCIRLLHEVRPDEHIVDIGPKTVAHFSSITRGAKTVVWNGPLGLVEIPSFAKGTMNFARALASSASFRVIGGGDTLAALGNTSLVKKFSHVSTGGGAMLEYLAGKKLPGIEALKK